MGGHAACCRGWAGLSASTGSKRRSWDATAELRTVKALFHACAERRTPRLVVVAGPAGVGKSRVGWEFEKYVDGLVDTIYWHRGRCLSYGEGVAFWALTEIVRQRLGIAEEDPLANAAAKLAHGLETLVPEESERGYIGPRLGRLLGVTLPGDSNSYLSREELFAGWRLFFERLAEKQPVILLVEDTQYGDTGLLDFVDHLVDWARDSPIFVLVFTRPELDQSRPGFGTGRNRSTLTLDPLDDASMDALINALVPDMPADATAAIRAQAEGIPLFAVETVRSLVDRDIVVPRDGVYRLVGELGELSVPDGLRALLAARLDALHPELRALVAEAAVLGSTFPADSLVAVSAQPEESVRDGLAELLRREVLSISADRLSPQRGDYRFAQDMLRQVAYETMTRRDRKARHLAVATHLRAAFPADGDEVAEVIARHYLDALAAIPDAPDVEDLRAQAVAMLVRSAERAVRAGASRPAASSYATAAEQTELAPQPSDGNGEIGAAPLWERAARAALDAFDVERALAYGERANRLYTGHGQVRAAARSQAISGEVLMRAGRHGEARERLTAALTVLRPDPDADTVTALERLAAVEIFSGGPDGDRLSAEALLLGQALDVDAGLLADLFTSRAIALYFANRWAEAVADLEYAARLAEGYGDSTRQARALLNMCEVLNRTDPIAAAGAARAAADLARRGGAVSRLIFALSNEAEALLLAGEWDEADRVLHDAIDHELPGHGIGSQVESWLAGLRGDIDTASDLAEEYRGRASEDAQDQAGIDLCDAIIASTQGRYADAQRRAQAVVAHASTLGIGHVILLWAWPLAARCAHTLRDDEKVAELLAVLDAHPVGHLPPLLRAERLLARARLDATRDTADAAGAFDTAVTALRQGSSPYHLAQGLLDYAEYLSMVEDGNGALPLVVEARTIGEGLRCQPLLDRADQMAVVQRAAETTTP